MQDLVKQTLEAKGLLGKLRAEMRAAVFSAIYEQDPSLYFGKTPVIPQTPNDVLVSDLIREFFLFYNLKYTESVLVPEANMPPSASSRDDIMKRLPDITFADDKPLLLSITAAVMNTPKQETLVLKPEATVIPSRETDTTDAEIEVQDVSSTIKKLSKKSPEQVEAARPTAHSVKQKLQPLLRPALLPTSPSKMSSSALSSSSPRSLQSIDTSTNSFESSPREDTKSQQPPSEPLQTSENLQSSLEKRNTSVLNRSLTKSEDRLKKLALIDERLKQVTLNQSGERYSWSRSSDISEENFDVDNGSSNSSIDTSLLESNQSGHAGEDAHSAASFASSSDEELTKALTQTKVQQTSSIPQITEHKVVVPITKASTDSERPLPKVTSPISDSSSVSQKLDDFDNQSMTSQSSLAFSEHTAQNSDAIRDYDLVENILSDDGIDHDSLSGCSAAADDLDSFMSSPRTAPSSALRDRSSLLAAENSVTQKAITSRLMSVTDSNPPRQSTADSQDQGRSPPSRGLRLQPLRPLQPLSGSGSSISSSRLALNTQSAVKKLPEPALDPNSSNDSSSDSLGPSTYMPSAARSTSVKQQPLTSMSMNVSTGGSKFSRPISALTSSRADTNDDSDEQEVNSVSEGSDISAEADSFSAINSSNTNSSRAKSLLSNLEDDIGDDDDEF